MDLKFSWYVSNQLQDWIVSKKPLYPSLEECIYWVKDKLKRPKKKGIGSLTMTDKGDRIPTWYLMIKSTCYAKNDRLQK